MKNLFSFLLIISFLPLNAIAQEPQQQLENFAGEAQEESEDDMYQQELARFVKHPVNLNTAGQNELQELRVLTDLQINHLLLYRRLLGMFIDIYELQAVPGWDIVTIRRLLPFVTAGASVTVKEDIGKRVKEGDHSLLLRVAQPIGNRADTAASGGSSVKMFFRYRYIYKNLLQYGWAGDKDAGEQFFRGAQKAGFDFYTFYLFARKIGSIESLALGDFTVNMGQGLIQWQSMSFKKSSEVMSVKKQSSVLRPYNSAGEFNFLRGAGITIRKGKIEITSFFSLRRLSATVAIDTTTGREIFSSFQTSGYHRTPAEIEDKNNLRQLTAGGNIKYHKNNLQVGINAVYYQFSRFLQKRDEPYNLFAIQGSNWYNASMDYSYTCRNFHVFGETAIDKNFHRAILNGLLISVNAKTDVSFVHRIIDMKYQAVNANAFTESTSPSNESGIYAGISVRPLTALRLDAYADMYKFSWLKYLVDAPSSGKDFLLRITYVPSRRAEIYMRYKAESKQGNGSAATATNSLEFFSKQNLRLQVNYKITPVVTVRNRVELIWYDKKKENSESGFLTYTDIIYKPPLKPFSAQLRLQHFETDGYDSRLYAYENDVLYSYSIPVFSGSGYRYSILLSYDLSRKISCWLRWGSTYSKSNGGVSEVPENKRDELKIQMRFEF